MSILLEILWYEIYSDPFTPSLVLSDLQQMKLMQNPYFSWFADIRQVQYWSKSKDTKNLYFDEIPPYFDEMPPLNKYGRFQHVLEAKYLEKLHPKWSTRRIRLEDKRGWQYEVKYMNMNGNEYFAVEVIQPYLPVTVWKMKLKVRAKFIAEYENGETRELLVKNRQIKAYGEINPSDHEKVKAMKKECGNITSIDLDIDWSVVALYDKDGEEIKGQNLKQLGLLERDYRGFDSKFEDKQDGIVLRLFGGWVGMMGIVCAVLWMWG